MREKIKGTLALLLGTIIWGSAFIAQSVGMEDMGPFTFQSIRCLLAVAALGAMLLIAHRGKQGFWASFTNARLWKAGSLCGMALFVAAGLQQMGLAYTDPGKAGFLTAMYIVLVPLLGVLLGKKPPVTALLSIIPAVAGLYLLSCMGVASINQGDLLMLGAALAFAVQITLIDRLSPGLDGLQLNFIQCLVCGLLSLLPMGLTEEPQWGAVIAGWFPLCYTGVLSMGVAYSLQIFGQQRLEPTAASLIMSMESVFAALSGWLILRQTMTGWETAGCVLMLGAVLLSQLPAKPKKAAP